MTKYFPPAASSGTVPEVNTKTATASGAISALKVVTTVSSGIVRQATSVDRNPLGIALTAASDGATLTVLTDGDHTDANWNWAPGLPLFVSPTGSLTQTKPTSGVLVRMGAAISATTVVIRPASPVDLV